MINEKIQDLKKKIVNFSNVVETMIKKSLDGLMDKNLPLLKEVKDIHEPIANELEIEVDEMCLSAVALFHPEARDLRVIMMILKMNNDFERMGDLAVNIADSAIFLIDKPPVKPLVDIPRMMNHTIKMLQGAITAFIEENTELAYEVVSMDDVVDDLRDQILRELITYMISDAKCIERAMQLIRIARNVERIADLTTNIAEDVIFITKGKFVKHHMSY